MAILINHLVLPSAPLAELFFGPVDQLFAADSRNLPGRPGLSDADFVRSGVLRVILKLDCGRDLLQSLNGAYAHLIAQDVVAKSTWFDALNSPHRHAEVAKAAQSVRKTVAALLQDRLAPIPQLDAYEVWLGDGHWHEACEKDAQVFDKSGDAARVPVGHVYFANARTGVVLHFATCEPGTQEHDMKVLMRGQIGRLKGEAGRTAEGGTRTTIAVYDRAAVNFKYWNNAKQSQGVRLITQAKEGLVLDFVEQRIVDEADPINARILSDTVVKKDGHLWRRIETTRAGSPGEVIVLLTNDLQLEPGVVAILALRRWDLERTYDSFKNHLGQHEAWTTSLPGKNSQGEFIALAWNLLLLLEHELEAQGVSNVAEENRRDARTAARQAEAEEEARIQEESHDEARRQTGKDSGSRRLPPKAMVIVPESPEYYRARQTRIPIKLVRWLRNHLAITLKSWAEQLEMLRREYRHL
jgi:hypothetical protein